MRRVGGRELPFVEYQLCARRCPFWDQEQPFACKKAEAQRFRDSPKDTQPMGDRRTIYDLPSPQAGTYLLCMGSWDQCCGPSGTIDGPILVLQDSLLPGTETLRSERVEIGK